MPWCRSAFRLALHGTFQYIENLSDQNEPPAAGQGGSQVSSAEANSDSKARRQGSTGKGGSSQAQGGARQAEACRCSTLA